MKSAVDSGRYSTGRNTTVSEIPFLSCSCKTGSVLSAQRNAIGFSPSQCDETLEVWSLPRNDLTHAATELCSRSQFSRDCRLRGHTGSIVKSSMPSEVLSWSIVRSMRMRPNNRWPEHWSKFPLAHPETGMDYQIVAVSLRGWSRH